MTERRRGDPHRMLLRALGERASSETSEAEILTAHSEAWASATFRGARHGLTLRMSGDDAGARAAKLAAELDEIEFRLPGHLVADIALTSQRDGEDGVTLEIEALTVEDA